VIGGLLSYSFGWRSNFFVAAALAFAGLGAAWLLLPADSFKPAAVKKEAFDVIGALGFGTSISLLLFGLAMAQKGGWQSPLVGLPLVGGMVILLLFIFWERRIGAPLLDLALFRIPAFSLGNGARWISFITMSIGIVLMPFFLQFARGLDPLRAGVLVAPTPLAMALLAPLAGWLSEKLILERMCAAGLAVSAIAFTLTSFLSPASGMLEIIFCLGLLGIGMGLFQTPNNNLLMTSVPRHRLGVGSAFLSIVRSLGYSLGATLAASIVSAELTAVEQGSLQSLAQPAGSGGLSVNAFLRGFQLAYWTAAALCFLGAVISAVRVSDHR
jgi:MFS family permease